MRHRFYAGRYAVLVLALVGLPMLGTVFAVVKANERETFDVPPEPVVLEVTASTVDASIAVFLRAEIDPVLRVLSPFNGGIVTSVYAEVGDSITAGQRVIRVDGVDRLTIGGSKPPWRTLSRGVSGPDVVALQELLVSIGLLDAADGATDGVFGRATADAVRLLGEQLGVERPSTVAPLEWFLWIPTEPFVIGETSTLVGQNAPAAGTPVFVEELRPVVVRVVGADGSAMRSDSELRVVEFKDTRLATSASKDGYLVLSDPMAFKVDDYDDDLTLPAALVLSEPKSVTVVPATAVVYSEGGACVVVAKTAGQPLHIGTPISVAHATVNQVGVHGLNPGESVVVNPRETGLSSLCS